MRAFGIGLTAMVLLFGFRAYRPLLVAEGKHSGPELKPRRPECGILFPERDERDDLAKLIRAEQFVRCERDGFPAQGPPWKTDEAAVHGMENACDYFAATSAKKFSQVGEDALTLARTRCYANIMTIELELLKNALPKE